LSRAPPCLAPRHAFAFFCVKNSLGPSSKGGGAQKFLFPGNTARQGRGSTPRSIAWLHFLQHLRRVVVPLWSTNPTTNHNSTTMSADLACF